MMLSAFPFLTADEFEAACRALADRACISATDGGWSSIRLVTQNPPSLKITRCMAVQSDALNGPDLKEEARELEDEDPVCSPRSIKDLDMFNLALLTRQLQEALMRTDLQAKLQIDYDILLSPTYRVPVLYFTLRWHNCQGSVGLDAVYQYVVPARWRDQVRSVGVMGAISFGYHPDSGTPAFYVHPCNTADAMAQIADAQSVGPGTYLILWLGLVGHSVNLHVPRELVTSAGASPP